jgi:hypothetical protein
MKPQEAKNNRFNVSILFSRSAAFLSIITLLFSGVYSLRGQFLYVFRNSFSVQKPRRVAKCFGPGPASYWASACHSIACLKQAALNSEFAELRTRCGAAIF